MRGSQVCSAEWHLQLKAVRREWALRCEAATFVIQLAGWQVEDFVFPCLFYVVLGCCMDGLQGTAWWELSRQS